MAEPNARIRLVQASDDKLVRFAIGKANMEALAVANRRASIHPVTLAVWIGLSCIFVEFMQWWPDSTFGWWGYISPLPAFAAMAVPLLSLIDWLNRPYFENHTQDVLRRPDVVNFQSHYLLSPSSGFWILEYGDVFVGLIAIDAAKNVPPSPSSSSNGVITAEKTKGTSSVATLRHFYVEELYRRIGMQNDLLTHAVRHTFDSDTAVQSIRAADSPLIPYIRESLCSAGFKIQEYTERVGILRWQIGVRSLQRSDWKTGDQPS